MCVTVCVCVLCVCVCVCVCVEGRCGGCMGHMYVRCTAPTLLPLCVCVCAPREEVSRGEGQRMDALSQVAEQLGRPTEEVCLHLLVSVGVWVGVDVGVGVWVWVWVCGCVGGCGCGCMCGCGCGCVFTLVGFLHRYMKDTPSSWSSTTRHFYSSKLNRRTSVCQWLRFTIYCAVNTLLSSFAVIFNEFGRNTGSFRAAATGDRAGAAGTGGPSLRAAR